MGEENFDLHHFKTISEVEDYVYSMINKRKDQNRRRDASLEDLMAVTQSEHSQDLTQRIQ